MQVSIPEMSCGKCKAKIEDALLDADEAAELDFDMEARTVSLVTELTANDAVNVLKSIGYDATVIG